MGQHQICQQNANPYLKTIQDRNGSPDPKSTLILHLRFSDLNSSETLWRSWRKETRLEDSVDFITYRVTVKYLFVSFNLEKCYLQTVPTANKT